RLARTALVSTTMAVITEAVSELLVDLLSVQRAAAPEPAGRRAGAWCPLPDQLVDLLRERDPIGGGQPVQPVARSLRHLDGRHGHTGEYTSRTAATGLRYRLSRVGSTAASRPAPSHDCPPLPLRRSLTAIR